MELTSTVKQEQYFVGFNDLSSVSSLKKNLSCSQCWDPLAKAVLESVASRVFQMRL